MVTLFIASTKFRMLYLVITGIMTIFGSVRQYYQDPVVATQQCRAFLQRSKFMGHISTIANRTRTVPRVLQATSNYEISYRLLMLSVNCMHTYNIVVHSHMTQPIHTPQMTFTITDTTALLNSSTTLTSRQPTVRFINATMYSNQWQRKLTEQRVHNSSSCSHLHAPSQLSDQTYFTMPKNSLYKLTKTSCVSSNSKQMLNDLTVARFWLQTKINQLHNMLN